MAVFQAWYVQHIITWNNFTCLEYNGVSGYKDMYTHMYHVHTFIRQTYILCKHILWNFFFYHSFNLDLENMFSVFRVSASIISVHVYPTSSVSHYHSVNPAPPCLDISHLCQENGDKPQLWKSSSLRYQIKKQGKTSEENKAALACWWCL